MKTRIQQALAAGYIERRGHSDREFNSYYAHCRIHEWPFVRLERHRTHYHVEVELPSESRFFTDTMHKEALHLFLPVLPGRPKATTQFLSRLISCDRVPLEHGHRIASELFVLASSAPLRK
jgi:hypothetical protein